MLVTLRRTPGPRKQSLGLVLVTLLATAPASGIAAEAESAGAGAIAGVLTVATNPIGANVYIDGQFAGQTPLDVSSLPGGSHRVRVAKTGYLENARVIDVAVGQPKELLITLTPDTSAAAAQVTGGGGGGGGVSKWVWIGIAGGAAGGTLAYLATKNGAPTAGSVTVTPSVALASSTSVSLTAQGASDPDGDSLTYSWTFGDGANGTGATTTHTYTTTGTFTPSVTVSDGKKSASAAGSVDVRSLSGTWRGQLSILDTVLTITQSGANVTGSYHDNTLGFNGTIAGAVSGNSKRVSLTITVPGFQPWTFTGDPNADINMLTGAANGSGFVNESWTLNRQ